MSLADANELLGYWDDYPTAHDFAAAWMRQGKNKTKGDDPRGMAMDAKISGFKVAKAGAIPPHMRDVLRLPPPKPQSHV